MTQRVFPFLQVEMPFRLGVPDGRWMLRTEGSGEVERVVVLAGTQAPRVRAWRRSARRAAVDPEPAPASVPVTRITLIAAQPLADEPAGRTWLAKIDPEHEIDLAFASLNRLLAAHRIAAADPYAHAVGPEQAIALRAGFGLGEQVAEGRWLQAQELHLPEPSRWRRGRRAAILRSHEHLAGVLASRRRTLVCEELTLRARLDLDLGRLPHAAGEIERALALAVVELKGEVGANLPRRVDELRELQGGVAEAAERLLRAQAPFADPDAASPDDAETLAHALGRLEAALRARATAMTWPARPVRTRRSRR